ncbi:MAG: hypothetical protein ACJ8EF_08940 [Bradyrhizobium sp.]|jgi:hypothetical protein
MSLSPAALFTIIAMLVAGATLTPVSAEAATISKAEKLAADEAIHACKSEAKGKKVAWLKRRKYVKRCVLEALKGRPTLDLNKLLRNHPVLKREQWDAI